MCRLGFISAKTPIEIRQLIEKATRYYGVSNPHGVGFSYVDSKKEIITIKSPKKASVFWESVRTSEKIMASSAIFHVRYASVGSVCKVNTHPLSNDSYSLVHNGTLTNWSKVRERLSKTGYDFKSTTDSEVILAAWTLYKENFLKFLKDQGVRGWYTVLILSKDGKIRAVTNSGYLVIYRRDTDAVGFSDDSFKNLRDRYKVESNILYTFNKGRLVSKQNAGGWNINEYVKKSRIDEDTEIRQWIKSLQHKLW